MGEDPKLPDRFYRCIYPAKHHVLSWKMTGRIQDPFSLENWWVIEFITIHQAVFPVLVDSHHYQHIIMAYKGLELAFDAT
jgi:hypothetical protein